MKKLTSLSYDEILNFVLGSKKLREKFDIYVYDCEIDYVYEKLECFGKCIDYRLGVYNRNYFVVIEGMEEEFLYSVEKSIRSFCSSTKLRVLVQKCNKLINTNLFKYKVHELCELYFKEELLPIIRDIENASFAIYNKIVTPFLLDYIEGFSDFYLDDIYINSENKLVKMEYIK